jgi:Pin2-interacting protein X1
VYKDDNLGLGARLQAGNPEQMRVGLDAFQGLLGRLNCKDEAEVKKLEQRSQDRQLAKWAQGRWGGVIFVPGGLLIQGDKFKNAEDNIPLPKNAAEMQTEICDLKADEKAAKALRNAARRERKDAKLKKTAGRNRRASFLEGNDELAEPTQLSGKSKQHRDRRQAAAESSLVGDVQNISSTDQKQKGTTVPKQKRKRQPEKANDITNHSEKAKSVLDAVQLPTPPSESEELLVSTETSRTSSRNVRHLIRGRNIRAKRMAFADAKMLDEVWET